MKHLVVFLLLIATPVLADREDHERARRALEAGEILPLSDILAVVEAAHAGRVIELELDRDDGMWIYELEVLTPEGQIYEMEIDAATGDVLEIERDREDD